MSSPKNALASVLLITGADMLNMAVLDGLPSELWKLPSDPVRFQSFSAGTDRDMSYGV